MKTTSSIFRIKMNGHANGSGVAFTESSIEISRIDREDLHRAWSVDGISQASVLAPKPLRKKRFFGTAPSIEGSWQVLAAQTLKIASINGLGRLDKLEHELEDEINYENRSPSKTRFGRFRRKGEHHLHSKIVLFFIVTLNIIDTLLVMIGLILDFHFVSLSLGAKSEMLTSFTEQLNEKNHIHEEEDVLLQHLLNAHIIFNVTAATENVTDIALECTDFLNKTATEKGSELASYMSELMRHSSGSAHTNVCFQPYYPGNHTHGLKYTGEVDHTLSTVAHKLHYCSISILSLLVVILILKLICFGRRFFKDRMLIFDGLITIISFVLDIVFTDGVTFFPTEQFVTILTLLFPWRVIRILNSLIAAVLDKHKLNLKVLYTQKKKISRSLTETNTKMEVLHRHIEVLQHLCSSRGIGDMEVSRALSGDSSGGSQKNGPGGGLASMMALGKLAFQAADAFAPISNGNKKGRDDSSSQNSSTFSSPIRSDFVEIKPVSDNNNAILKNQNEAVTKETIFDGNNSPNTVPADPENITIHMNGSGPPRERDTNFDHSTRFSHHNAEDREDNNEDTFDSRL